ncbi:hypothetical protein STEG23_028258 [Scotinomys teguina]
MGQQVYLLEFIARTCGDLDKMQTVDLKRSSLVRQAVNFNHLHNPVPSKLFGTQEPMKYLMNESVEASETMLLTCPLAALARVDLHWLYPV